MQKIKKQNILKYLSLALVLLLSVFLFTTPKTFAYTYEPNATVHGYSNTDFTPYMDEVQHGSVWGAASEYSVVHIPLTDEIFIFHFSNFTSAAIEAIVDYNELWNAENHGAYSLEIKWNPSSKLWSLELEDMQPVLNGETAFVTDINNPIKIHDILSRVKAIDNEDGDISHLIQIDTTNSTYTDSINSVGQFLLKLFVFDTAGNRADLTIHVLVKDVETPVITGPKTFSQSYTSKKEISSIISQLSVTDNYDQNSLTIKVKTDNYSSNYSKTGSYDIVFYAVDSSGNEGTYTVTINVIDDVAPVFTGPTKFVKGQTQILLLADILKDVSVSDVIDKNVKFVVKEDTYTGNGHKVGTWKITLEATDSSGNKATHVINITVSDDIPPIYYVDNFFINVEDTFNLTRDDIINLLVISGQLNITTQTRITFLTNEYEGNETNEGIYAVVVEATTASTTNKFSLAVQVHGTEDTDDIIVKPENNFFENVWEWLNDTFPKNTKIYNYYYVIFGLSLLGLIIVKKKRY